MEVNELPVMSAPMSVRRNMFSMAQVSNNTSPSEEDEHHFFAVILSKFKTENISQTRLKILIDAFICQ